MSVDLSAAFQKAFDNHDKALKVAEAVKELCQMMCDAYTKLDSGRPSEDASFKIDGGSSQNLADSAFNGFQFDVVKRYADDVREETNVIIYPSGRVEIALYNCERLEINTLSDRTYFLDLSKSATELAGQVLGIMTDGNHNFGFLMSDTKKLVASAISAKNTPAPIR